MNPKRSSSRPFALPALLAGLVLLSAAEVHAFTIPTQVSDAGSTENSGGRHIVQNSYGYWAFVNIGKPAVVFSADGINWGNETPIWPSTDWPSMLGNPAIYYVKKSS